MKACGHYFFRGVLSQGAGSLASPTAFDAEGRVCIFYDGRRKCWSAHLDEIDQTIRVPFEPPENTPTLITLSYLIDSSPGASDIFWLKVGTGLKNHKEQRLCTRGLPWLLRQRGNVHIGCTRTGQNQVNGYVPTLGYGPGQIGKDTWQVMLQDPTIMPSMYDADVLDAALLEINRLHNQARLILPNMAKLF